MFNIQKKFSYGYLPGSNLLQTLTMPCNMTLTQSYETQRDLLIGMAYLRGNTLVTQRSYTYDTLGRPLTRSTARNGQTVNDSFVHNSRSELTGATVNGCTYGYTYDNIGNRNTATEGEEVTAYTANNLNQYTSIQENEEAAFVPTFDADGNQTLVKTSTGIWSVQYNAENRPVRFTSTDGSTVIECSYDTHGRRATKKVTTNGSITLHQRYIYRGYLQLACCDLTRSGHPCLWLLTWDPTQPIATRPLAIRKDGTWYAYGWDLTKNICEVFGQHGYLRTAYTYSPYGEVTADGDVTQPIQWSSEYNDTELALVYYNYRHYNPLAGRWMGRDIIEDIDGSNLYNYVQNRVVSFLDLLGLKIDESHGTKKCHNKLSCDDLQKSLDAWKKHYEKRYRELLQDKYNLKKTNPTKYNNHVVKLNEAKKGIQKCEMYIKINKCCDGGNSAVPVYETHPVPSMIENSDTQSKLDIPWEPIAIGGVILVGVIASMVSGGTAAPAATAAALVVVSAISANEDTSNNTEA